VIETTVDLDEFLVTDLVDEINDFDREAALARADEWLAENADK
jgi:hypothetical protein